MAILDLLDVLACPHCGWPLSLSTDGRAVRCENGHSFDLARQGYLNLLGSKQPRNADTGPMITARDHFLSAGHYQPIAERLSALAAGSGSGADSRLLDTGTGTGYYLATMLDRMTDARGVGLDVSVAAARHAARAHPRLAAVVADVWQPLPLRDGQFDVVSSVFAPRNAEEFHRVLKPTGRLLVVSPEPEHLAELREPLGLLSIEEAKSDRLEAALSGRFEADEAVRVQFGSALDGATLGDLVRMGPNAFHLDEPAIAQGLRDLPVPLTVTVAVTISVWAPRRP